MSEVSMSFLLHFHFNSLNSDYYKYEETIRKMKTLLILSDTLNVRELERKEREREREREK